MEEREDKNKRGLNISALRFFWEISPLLKLKKTSVARFLRSLPFFENFSDNDLRILSTYLHHRYYNKGDVIFKKNDLGVGFYIINSGKIKVVLEGDLSGTILDCHQSDQDCAESIILEKGDYFGELALVQENNVRSAGAISMEATSLLVFYKPDLSELIDEFPAVAAKFLQSLSSIVASRLFYLSREVGKLKQEIKYVTKN